jgi:hypothetical protein
MKFDSKATHYELRFHPRGGDGPVLSFPCDAQGHVALDELSEAALEEYLYARAVMGGEFEMPSVCAADEMH